MSLFICEYNARHMVLLWDLIVNPLECSHSMLRQDRDHLEFINAMIPVFHLLWWAPEDGERETLPPQKLRYELKSIVKSLLFMDRIQCQYAKNLAINLPGTARNFMQGDPRMCPSMAAGAPHLHNMKNHVLEMCQRYEAITEADGTSAFFPDYFRKPEKEIHFILEGVRKKEGAIPFFDTPEFRALLQTSMQVAAITFDAKKLLDKSNTIMEIGQPVGQYMAALEHFAVCIRKSIRHEDGSGTFDIKGAEKNFKRGVAHIERAIMDMMKNILSTALRAVMQLGQQNPDSEERKINLDEHLIRACIHARFKEARNIGGSEFSVRYEAYREAMVPVLESLGWKDCIPPAHKSKPDSQPEPEPMPA